MGWNDVRSWISDLCRTPTLTWLSLLLRLKRLRSIYSQSGSFSSYSSDFLDVIEFLMTPNDARRHGPPPEIANGVPLVSTAAEVRSRTLRPRRSLCSRLLGLRMGQDHARDAHCLFEMPR